MAVGVPIPNENVFAKHRRWSATEVVAKLDRKKSLEYKKRLQSYVAQAIPLAFKELAKIKAAEILELRMKVNGLDRDSLEYGECYREIRRLTNEQGELSALALLVK